MINAFPRLFCCAAWSSSSASGFWFRVLGVGVQVTNAPPPFSVRYGHEKVLWLGRGWRAKILRRHP